MGLPWFRMYSRFANDADVQMMPEHMQRRLIMIFCLRCEETLVTSHETSHETSQGTSHWEMLQEKEIAFRLRVTEQELAETKALFVRKGYIDKSWNLLNWNALQFLSDSSTDRTRRYRERKRTSQERSVTADVTVQIQKQIQSREEKQNPSREKRERREVKHSSDPRHVACKAEIFSYFQTKNSADPDWNGREGKALGMLLGANPKLTAEEIRRLLDHRARSEVNHAERPGMWIERLGSFRAGPLDRFGKPLGIKSNGGNGHYETRNERIVRQTLEKLDREEAANTGESQSSAGS